AKARRDVVGDGRDLPVAVGSAESWHGKGAAGGLAVRSRQHDLRDVGRGRIVHRATAGKGCTRGQLADAGPAVAACTGSFEDLLAVRIDVGSETLFRIRGRGRGFRR